MNDTGKREEALKKLKQGDLQRLAEERLQARDGKRLNSPRHLQAALELGRQYRSAKKEIGFSDEQLIERVLERLEVKGNSPESFNIRKHILEKSIHSLTPQKIAEIKRRPWPQRSLSHYLAAIGALASLTGEDEHLAQIRFLRTAGVWMESRVDESNEGTWEAINSLTDDLHKLSASVSLRYDLLECFRHQIRLNARCHQMAETISISRTKCTLGNFSPVYPDPELGINIDELRQIPTVPLVWIPMGWAEGDVRIDQTARPKILNWDYPGTDPEEWSRVTAPPDSSDWPKRPATVIQAREIRLALAPLNDREVGAVLQTRGLVLLSLNGVLYPVWGCNHWDEPISLPHQIFLDGAWHRVDSTWPELKLDRRGEWSGLTNIVRDQRTGEAIDWDWEHDPVESPGVCHGLGPDYISFTRMTADHLYHWLVSPHDLSGVPAISPWELRYFEAGQRLFPRHLEGSFDPDRYWENIDDPRVLQCPFDSPARAIETCLYNGLLKAALEQAAGRMKSETTRIMKESQFAAVKARANLRASWKENLSS